MGEKASAAGENAGLDGDRIVHEKRRGGRCCRGGLVALLGVVAIAGCGGSDDEDLAKTRGGAGKARVTDPEPKPGGKLQTLDRQTVRGEFATAQAAGTAKRPRRILMSMKATPPQKVQASWSLTCLKGQKAGTRDGLRVLESPFAVTLKQPRKGSESCVVAITGQLTKKGSITVKLASSSR